MEGSSIIIRPVLYPVQDPCKDSVSSVYVGKVPWGKECSEWSENVGVKRESKEGGVGEGESLKGKMKAYGREKTRCTEIRGRKMRGQRKGIMRKQIETRKK